MAQVIDVSDDEVCEILSEQPRKHNKCLNSDCKSSNNLIKASDAIKRYYGLQNCKRKNICRNCLKHVLVEKNNVINLLKSGTNLFSKDILLSQKTLHGDHNSNSDDVSDSSSEQSEYEYDPLEIKGIITNNRIVSGSVLATEDDKKELKNIVLDIIKENHFHKQISDGQKILQSRLRSAEKQFNNLNKEYKNIEEELDNVRNKFYDICSIDEIFLPSLEIGPLEMFNETFELTEVISGSSLNASSNFPPIAPLIRNPIESGDKVYLGKSSKLAKWVEGTVQCTELLPDKSETIFKIQYVKDGDKLLKKFVSAKNLAYFWECPVRVPIGTRIIALVENEMNNSFYVGIIAEIPTAVNRYRYLVFFDDGYAQYVAHSNIRIVCQGDINVWKDVEEESRNFIKEYLETYPERPMVRLQKGNHIKTELEGDWFKAEVIEVDCSLVKMIFPIQCRYEWIYRGSTRLSPLYHRKINSKIKSELPNRIVKRRTLPVNKKGHVVEYINVATDNEDRLYGNLPNLDQTEVYLPNFEEPENVLSNAIDKPSIRQATSQKNSSFQEQNICSIPISEQLMLESQGYYTTIKCNITSNVNFSFHQCSSRCIRETSDILDSRIISPLIRPLMLGWKREISKKKRKTITILVCSYVAPCGRRLRTYDEILLYLILTKSNLQIDEFTLESNINPLSAWEPTEKKVYISDITKDREYVHISCVNSIDLSMPKELLYCSERVPSEKVLINLDADYLVCCSCEDDCKDKKNCECWQLTLDTANTLLNKLRTNLHTGYSYKKLLNQIPSGIYECNARCSCKESCLNRVVQFPIKQKFQIFKTAKRGWGVRTLNDIPKGTFVCVYVGKLLTEMEANENGLQEGGDDYYANLDYIEVVESFKEGYESDVEDIENEKDSRSSINSSTESDNSDSESDSDEPLCNKIKRKKIRREKVLKSDSDSNSDEPLYNKMKRKKLRCEKVLKNKIFGEPRKTFVQNPEKILSKENVSISINKFDSNDSNDNSNRQHQTFEPKQNDEHNYLPNISIKNMREYYSNEEAIYVMDAKVVGNIGRYINHSCNPNIFVQNVFVDTHDPRFPWISFFAGEDIRAGVELTWDYNYEVGSVPGRIKYCYCGSSKCRGRLL